MNRREALASVSVLLGGAIIGAEVFLSGCKTKPLQRAYLIPMTSHCWTILLKPLFLPLPTQVEARLQTQELLCSRL